MRKSKNDNNAPVRVTGGERKHPAIRQLARACIEIARQRLTRQPKADTPAAGLSDGSSTEPEVHRG